VASAGPYQVCTSLQTDNHASTPPLTILNSHLYWSTSVRIDAPKNEYLLKWIFTVTWSSGSGCYVELVREWTTGSCILVFCVNLLVPVDWTLDVLVCWHMITNACCRFVLHPSYTCLTIGGKNFPVCELFYTFFSFVFSGMPRYGSVTMSTIRRPRACGCWPFSRLSGSDVDIQYISVNFPQPVGMWASTIIIIIINAFV